LRAPPRNWLARSQGVCARRCVHRWPRTAPSSMSSIWRRRSAAGASSSTICATDRTATAVAPLSPRARPGAPVSMPLAWSSVKSGLDPKRFTIRTAPKLIAASKAWSHYHEAGHALRSAIERLAKGIIYLTPSPVGLDFGPEARVWSCRKARFHLWSCFAMFPDQETARVYLEARSGRRVRRARYAGLANGSRRALAGTTAVTSARRLHGKDGTIFERSHVPLPQVDLRDVSARHSAQGQLSSMANWARDIGKSSQKSALVCSWAPLAKRAATI